MTKPESVYTAKQTAQHYIKRAIKKAAKDGELDAIEFLREACDAIEPTSEERKDYIDNDPKIQTILLRAKREWANE